MVIRNYNFGIWDYNEMENSTSERGWELPMEGDLGGFGALSVSVKSGAFHGWEGRHLRAFI